MKAFLKKHYEKILLAFLLVVFILLLLFQLILLGASEKIQVDKLKHFREPPPNYTQVKFDVPESPYRVLERLPEKPHWNEARPRGVNAVHFTDLMIPYPMALCPYCLRIIPADSYPAPNTLDSGKCPFRDCGKTLRAPYRSAVAQNQDSDGDGIPDKEETAMGLNPQDPSDAAVDSDDDGFSNYEEYLAKTKHKDPKNRPPYHEKIQVRSVTQARLPFLLKNVSFKSDKSKKNAEIQFEVDLPATRGRRPSKNMFLKVGESFPTLAGQFLIEDIVSSGDEVQVVLKKSDNGERITVTQNKPVLEPRIKAVLFINLIKDVLEKEVYDGSKFTIGSLKTNVDSYEVVSIDREKNTVTLKDTRDGKTYVIEQKSMIQKKIDAVRKPVPPRRQPGNSKQ